MKKNSIKHLAAFMLLAFSIAPIIASPYKYSSFTEKERPQLNEETKKLIAAYRANPSKKNMDALRKQVEINYDKVIERKKAKLEELRKTARHANKISEMEEIVKEVIKDRENRIEQSMRRFTDPRLKPNARKPIDGFLPVLGAGLNISIAYTPVTNSDFLKFVNDTGAKPPKNWTDGKIPKGKEKHPVVCVLYSDAVKYCEWLSRNNNGQIYRLPTETEWEYAAGHMPKDADFNCERTSGTTAVDAFSKTISACGAIDMWGNCKEMTSTRADKDNKPLIKTKGGSWRSKIMDCRTEERNQTTEINEAHDDVGFRVIRETK